MILIACRRNPADRAGLDKALRWATIWNKSFKTRTCLVYCYTLSIIKKIKNKRIIMSSCLNSNCLNFLTWNSSQKQQVLVCFKSFHEINPGQKLYQKYTAVGSEKVNDWMWSGFLLLLFCFVFCNASQTSTPTDQLFNEMGFFFFFFSSFFQMKPN